MKFRTLKIHQLKIHRLSFAACLLSLTAMTLPAMAEDFYFDPYAGVGAGQFQLSTGSSTTTNPGGFVFFGAEVHPYLAPEIRIGKANSGSITGFSNVSLDWFASYLLRLQAPVNEDTTVYGLVGGTTMRTALTPIGGTKLTDTSTNFSFGVGLNYRPIQHLSLGAEWVRYGRGYKSASTRGLNVTGIAGVVAYSF